MTITIPTTINAIIVITLISDNQNSSSPNNLALNKFIPTSTRIVNATVNQLGIAGYQNSTYLATGSPYLK